MRDRLGRTACVCAFLGLGAAAAVVWFGLGMQRGPLLPENVKSVVWPWAPVVGPRQLASQELADTVWEFVPWVEFARREFGAGRIPLWNPHQDGGVPLLGNGQSAVASPLLAPALLLGVERGWNLSLLLRTLFGGLGAFFWLRSLLRSRPAALLGAAMFALSGAFVAWLEHPHTLTAAAAPWVLLFAGRIARGGTAGDVLGLAAATFTALAGGHPETAVQIALLAGGWLLVEAHTMRDGAHAAGAALGGALLAAPLLLPLAEYLLLSEAWAGVGRKLLVLPTGALARLVWPAAAGPAVESAAAVSVVGAVLAATGLLFGRRERRTLFAVVAVAAMLLVAYDNPVARWLSNHTPVYWSRVLLLIPLPLALLAARGLDGLRDALGRSRRWAAAAVWAAPLVAGSELLAAAQGVHAVSDHALRTATPPIVEFLRRDRDVFRVLPLHSFLPANAATEVGLDDVRGFDALSPREWRRIRGAIGRFAPTRSLGDAIEPWELTPGGAGLDRWNVKYLLLHPQLPYTAAWFAERLGLDLEEVYRGADGVVLRNRRVRPRVEASVGTVRITGRTSTYWRAEADTPAATTVTVANPFFPGWTAEVDGRRIVISSRVGEAIEVPVRAGHHVLELRYRPRSFTLGCLGATAGVALLVAMVVAHRKRTAGSEVTSRSAG